MDSESLYLCTTAIALPMGVLMCMAHLLSLLRPLRFIINACNKCVTLTLIVINGNDDPRLFFDSSVFIVQNFSSSSNYQSVCIYIYRYIH